ncbi:hypothetical protein OJF2_58120 [Aquisphaera giovannonii]|uniref:Retroviral aspartyl protease n=1 Tax=Aquisphaera giovannonii TaxID=406548 RepID=A0A5B9WAV0_9BACT|nr:retropepsin-like aspartic protease [Aquisphaera giovannonii]QEH37225.1 hypothetical protein OJF2_58120 [Aquisphaera giovannonii]
MFASQLVPRLAIAASLLLAAQAAAQGPPAPAANDPAQSSPEEALKGQSLKKSGAAWILPDEASILKDLRDARELYRRVEQGMAGQQQFEIEAQRQKMEMTQLRTQSSLLQQQVEHYDQQLEQMGSSVAGNPLFNYQRDELSQERNRIVGALNQVNNRLNQLDKEDRDRDKNRDSDPSLLLNAEVAEAREKYMQSIYDLRKAVDALRDKYAELAKKPEVTQALDALSASSRSKQRLGPSKPLLEAIKFLEKAEGSVKSESIELHREGGVFHVYATLNKVPTKMVFDTGAGLTTLSAKLAQKIGVKSSPTDQDVELKTADGTLIKTKVQMIPSVRVGKFNVPNVECAVMPEDKGDIDPLLGQSFFKHFKVEFRPDAGRLSLKRLETESDNGAKGVAGSGNEFNSDPPASTKATDKASPRSRRPTRTTRPTPRGRRPATPKGDMPADPATGNSSPN